jgi:hypothetical protein
MLLKEYGFKVKVIPLIENMYSHEPSSIHINGHKSGADSNPVLCATRLPDEHAAFCLEYEPVANSPGSKTDGYQNR